MKLAGTRSGHSSLCAPLPREAPADAGGSIGKGKEKEGKENQAAGWL